MFLLELVLRYSPVSLSVQRKSEEDAMALYQHILSVMQNSAATPLLELTCEKEADKKIAVLSSEILAVQVSEKSGTAAASGRPPGFFALSKDEAEG